MSESRLPVVDVGRTPAGGVEPAPPGAAGDDGGRTGPARAGGSGGPPRPETPARRLVVTLAAAGALAGLVIVLVHQWADPRIRAHQARVLREAVYEVLGGPERYETAFLVDGAFTTAPPPAADTAALERVWIGFDRAGTPVGVAVAGAEPGFQDVIRLIFGYDPAAGEVLGMKVLESKETPGLGDKIEKDSTFVAGFRGVATPLIGVKPGAGRGEGGEVDMITGATISSRTVIDIINRRLVALGDPLAELWAVGAGGGAGAVAGGAR